MENPEKLEAPLLENWPQTGERQHVYGLVSGESDIIVLFQNRKHAAQFLCVPIDQSNPEALRRDRAGERRVGRGHSDRLLPGIGKECRDESLAALYRERQRPAENRARSQPAADALGRKE